MFAEIGVSDARAENDNGCATIPGFVGQRFDKTKHERLGGEVNHHLGQRHVGRHRPELQDVALAPAFHVAAKEVGQLYQNQKIGKN